MFKKIGIVLLAAALLLTLTSCGVKESVNDKIAEKVTEGVMNKATGGDANIDIDGDKITVEGKDGEKVIIGDSEWPAVLTDNRIPEFKSGKILSSINVDNGCMVMMEEVESEDFKQYLADIKAAGYTNDATELNSPESQIYSAYLNENTMVYLQYAPESKTLNVSLEVSE